MTAADKYTTEAITWTHRWAPNLISLRVTRPPEFRFVAGQFARLGLVSSRAPSGPIAPGPVWRAYSVVSSTRDDFLEFCSVLLPEGAFTSELALRSAGSEILVEKLPFGFLTTERFVRSGDLWMFATGTGLAPFLSILAEPAHWSEFRTLIVVHSVRTAAELAYRETLLSMARTAEREGGRARLVYVPIVTREPGVTELSARIPQLIEDGRLELATTCRLVPEDARVMLCGNPEMVSGVRALLSPRGFAPSRRGAPGTLAVENYW